MLMLLVHIRFPVNFLANRFCHIQRRVAAGCDCCISWSLIEKAENHGLHFDVFPEQMQRSQILTFEQYFQRDNPWLPNPVFKILCRVHWSESQNMLFCDGRTKLFFLNKMPSNLINVQIIRPSGDWFTEQRYDLQHIRSPFLHVINHQVHQNEGGCRVV